jgi:hypothetical protein
MSSMPIRSARISRLIARLTVSSARWRRSSTARLSSVCQVTVRPWSIVRCPSASTRGHARRHRQPLVATDRDDLIPLWDRTMPSVVMALDGRARRPCSARPAAWPPRPRGALCAPSPDSPSPPAADAPRRRGSVRASDRPTPRSSPQTHPAAAAAAPTPADRRRPHRGRAPSARPSCDHTRQAPLHHAACPQIKRLQDLHHFLRAPQARLLRASNDKAPRATDRSGRNHGEIRWPPMGRSNGRHWGLLITAYGEIPMAAVSRG